ncbi:MAG: FKBP-type peptidyl-prolyl cis-trans isomerase, partial [Sphingomonadales bacterium]
LMILSTTKNTLKEIYSRIISLYLIIAGIALLSACSKTDNNDPQSTACTIKATYKNDSSATQRAQMIAFCNNNGITYTIHPSGILYQIITPGDTAKPNLCTSLTMTYTGKLMTGIQFDKGTITYPLKDLIVGWQIAVPLIGKGGKIKMVIPSSLAYGPNANGSIPANSPLYFEMSID